MRNITRRHDYTQGFTLIELLVVIAIIAILAAILFPVFARARENGRRASCQSNLKQIALGMFQYTQDFDEKFPIMYASDGTGAAVTTSNVSSSRPYGWADAIQPYLKSTQIFQCPSERYAPAGTSTSGMAPDPTFVPAGGPGYTDYGYNRLFAAGTTLAVVSEATRTVLLYDSVSYSSRSVATGGGTCPFDTGNPVFAAVTCTADTTPQLAVLPTLSSDSGAIRHLDGANLAFADGHVKWFKRNGGDTLAKVYRGGTSLSLANGSPTFSLQ